MYLTQYNDDVLVFDHLDGSEASAIQIGAAASCSFLTAGSRHASRCYTCILFQVLDLSASTGQMLLLTHVF